MSCIGDYIIKAFAFETWQLYVGKFYVECVGALTGFSSEIVQKKMGKNPKIHYLENDVRLNC